MLLEDMWCKYILGSEKYTRPLEIILENVLQKEPFSLQGKLSDITFERPVSKITYDTKNRFNNIT